MARHLLRSLVAASFIVVAFCQAAEPQNYALLIGVAEYSHPEMNQPKLAYPEADAKAVGEFLSQRGYEVEYLLGKEATRKAIDAKLDDLGTKGSAGGTAVLGLWGHGVEFADTQEAMFCPYDAKLRVVKDSQGNALRSKEGQPLIEPDPATLVGMTRLLAGLRICGAGNRLLLADCCRNSPNQPRGRAFGSQVKLSDLPKDSAAIFACSADERAFEDARWGHGAMTKCLLDLLPGMAEEESDVNAVTGKLRRGVSELVRTASGGRDTQTVHPIVNGIVELKLVRPPVGPQPAMPKPEPVVMRSESAKPEAVGLSLDQFEMESASPELVPPSQSPSMLGAKAGEVRTLVFDPKIEFCWCPPGSFTMGDSAAEIYDYNKGWVTEDTRVDATLSKGYWLGRTEVTQDQWNALVDDGPWEQHVRNGESVRQGADFPANYVSWREAVTFCGRLTERERKSGRLPADWEFALPTDAQWEYACRAGSATAYSFGNSPTHLDDYAWFAENALSKGERYAHPVALKLSNPWGLYDMHGNVSEWCLDSHRTRPSGGVDPLVGELDAEYVNRVYRGGSWNVAGERLRSGSREKDGSTLGQVFVGFRLACVRSAAANSEGAKEAN